jgi:hypothetical protein
LAKVDCQTYQYYQKERLLKRVTINESGAIKKQFFDGSVKLFFLLIYISIMPS